MVYDTIIIGAGAAGLFAAANIHTDSGLILNKAKRPGLKLLMAGAGQCNVTHAGDFSHFSDHYGPAGKKIRSLLSSLSSRDLINWFQLRGLALIDRGDGKIFPRSMDANDVLRLLLKEAEHNGFKIENGEAVCNIIPPGEKDDLFHIVTENHHRFTARHIILAAGGSSYPTTGSDGSMLSVIEELGHSITPVRPALVPLNVENYPYAQISGNAVRKALVYIYEGKQRTKKAPAMFGDVLLTHKNFSGPGILDMSRYSQNGKTLEINWYPSKDPDRIYSEINALRNGNRRQCITVFNEYFRPDLSEAHIQCLLDRAGIVGSSRIADITSTDLKKLIRLITADTFVISGTAGFGSAMCTAGGISLKEINIKTMESKIIPGLYIIGECLDVDGDTGGYNIHFAFAGATAAAKFINS